MYKKGDRVVCVNAGECRGLESSPELENGALYWVARDQTDPNEIVIYYFLRGGEPRRVSYWAERFCPAAGAPAQAPGQKDDQAKLRVDLIPADALLYVLREVEADRAVECSTDTAIEALTEFEAIGDLTDLALAVAYCLELVDPSRPLLVANGLGLEEVARVLHYGAHLAPRPDGTKGYGENNWEGVRPVKRYTSAMLRHLLRLAAGETNDRESSLHHAAHAACCGLFVIAVHLRTNGGES